MQFGNTDEGQAVSPLEEYARWLSGIALVAALDLQPVAARDGGVSCLLPFRPDLSDRRLSSTISNGAILAAIDQAGSVAVRQRFGLSYPHATVSLNASFVNVADTQALRFDSRFAGSNGNYGYTTVSAHCANTDLLVALGHVVFVMGKYPGAGSNDIQAAPQTQTPPNARDFAAFLGYRPDKDGATIPPSPHIMGSKAPPALHGGAIAAGLAEAAAERVAALGALRLSHFSLEFLRAGFAHPTRFHSALNNRSRATATISANAFQQDGERHVATATARFVETEDN